jgi:hypothetical protein
VSFFILSAQPLFALKDEKNKFLSFQRFGTHPALQFALIICAGASSVLVILVRKCYWRYASRLRGTHGRCTLQDMVSQE